MKRTILKTLLFLPVLTVLGCAVASNSFVTIPDPELPKLAKYRQWTLVNPTPQFMDPPSAIACGINFGRTEASPHVKKYVSVYVNSVGREAMMTKRRPKFPVGTMIVKEKLGDPLSTNPELLTAMIKREPGYNPENGDWEYLMLDGEASKIVERGKLTRCSGCHQHYEKTDFVTRSYLPEKVALELKP